MKQYIGVEIGGTKQQAASFDESGALIELKSERIALKRGAEDILDWMRETVPRLICAEREVGGLVGQGGGEHGGGGEDEHGFAVVAFFDGVDAFDGLGVGGVAAYAPDGVGGVEEGLAALQGRQGSCE